MKTIRPAFLVLLTLTLAGLGVPADFGQSKARANSGKKPASSGSSAKSRQPNSASSTKTATKPPAKASAKSSPKTTVRTSIKSSRRSRKQPGQKAPTSDRISEIQVALARNGSYQGSPTGKWDDDTAAAMRKFQESHGLKPNGRLDAPSLQRLGLGSQTAGVAAPTPPPGATSRLTSANSAPSPAESRRQ